MSGRRGVHHSGGLRAKRYWLRWSRYQDRCDVLAGHEMTRFGRSAPASPMFEGYAMAYDRWARVGRYAPIGIRDVRP